MSILDFLLRLGAALLCGSLIGVERQFRQHETGLRTSALVSSGSALFVLVAALTTNDSSPTRIAAQVVSGVGFLCAGVILRDGLHIRGLNTAGTLWCASGVGVLAGSGFIWPALAGTGVVLVANLVLRPLGEIISRHAKESADVTAHYLLRVNCPAEQETQVRSLLLKEISDCALGLRALQSGKDAQDAARVEVAAHLHCSGRQDMLLEQVVARLSLENSITLVRWEVVQSEEGGPVMLFQPKGQKTSTGANGGEKAAGG